MAYLMRIMVGMSIEQFQLHLVRVDRHRNLARFYRISLGTTLLGDFAVERNWGRIGTLGRTKFDLFFDEKSALRHLLVMVKQKRGRGYRPG